MPQLATTEKSTSEKSSGATTFESLLERTGAKDRTNVQKHLALMDAEEDGAHAALWRRIAGVLARLAPMPVQTVGQSAVLFFIPDGKYRMQVFSLEDQRDGRVLLYLPDVLDAAIKAKLLRKGSQPGEYQLARSVRTTIHIEALDAQNTPEPPAHVKSMLGWNRKALRVTLPNTDASGGRVEAAEGLCTLAARQWAGKTA